MTIIIKEVMIRSFRGLQDLTVKNLNHVNVIVGDNNSGKTSVLEALLVLRNPESLTNLIRITRQREFSLYRTPTYEGFINLFRKKQQMLQINVKAKLADDSVIEASLMGNEKLTILEEEEIDNRILRNWSIHKNHIQEKFEVMAFEGELNSNVYGKSNEKHIFLHEQTRFSGMEIERVDCLEFEYLSPFDHLMGSNINRIVRNESYKSLCIDIIRLFDDNITDIKILKNEQTNRPVEYINHSILGDMPLSTYGDGIKKVLSIANAIAQSANGILLIDEVETAIHSKYYDKIFSFLTMASKHFNVQLFLTTHSIEAIDSLLATQNYDNQDTTDDISVITIKKAEDKTYSRVLSGRQVTKNRESFGFEVRI